MFLQNSFAEMGLVQMRDDNFLTNKTFFDERINEFKQFSLFGFFF